MNILYFMLLLSFWPFNRISEKRVVKNINEYRHEMNLPPLVYDKSLNDLCKIDKNGLMYLGPNNKFLADTLWRRGVDDYQINFQPIQEYVYRDIKRYKLSFMNDVDKWLGDSLTNRISVAFDPETKCAMVLLRKDWIDCPKVSIEAIIYTDDGFNRSEGGMTFHFETRIDSLKYMYYNCNSGETVCVDSSFVKGKKDVKVPTKSKGYLEVVYNDVVLFRGIVEKQ